MVCVTVPRVNPRANDTVCRSFESAQANGARDPVFSPGLALDAVALPVHFPSVGFANDEVAGRSRQSWVSSERHALSFAPELTRGGAIGSVVWVLNVLGNS